MSFVIGRLFVFLFSIDCVLLAAAVCEVSWHSKTAEALAAGMSKLEKLGSKLENIAEHDQAASISLRSNLS